MNLEVWLSKWMTQIDEKVTIVEDHILNGAGDQW